jgi:probable addiction module antidote protein
MGEETMPRSRSYQAKLLEDLQNPEEAAAYLDAALEAGEREPFLLALRNVAEAQGGLGKLADITSLNRENLYRMLSNKGNPEFYSLHALLQALGLRLAIEPKHALSTFTTVGEEQKKTFVMKTQACVLPPTKKLALAADTSKRDWDRILAVTQEGKEIGVLEYDFQHAELYLRITGDLPKWHMMDVEIKTKDGKQFLGTTTQESEDKLVLLRGKAVKREKIDQILLRPHQ